MKKVLLIIVIILAVGLACFYLLGINNQSKTRVQEFKQDPYAFIEKLVGEKPNFIKRNVRRKFSKFLNCKKMLTNISV